MNDEKQVLKRKGRGWLTTISLLLIYLLKTNQMVEATSLTNAHDHVGTFEESTLFVATGSNGVKPGLFVEVMDRYGEYTQYESEDGIVLIPETKEGAYVSEVKILGVTKYRDLNTNELLDEWEEGRDLELVSVENPKLKIIGKNLFDGEIQYGSLSGSSGVGTSFEGTFINPSSTRAYSRLYDVTSNKLSITMKNPNQKYALYQWDENMNRIYGESWQSVTSRTIVLNERTRYVSLYMANGDDSPIDLSEFEDSYQLELSDVATTYKPYQSAELETNGVFRLRGIKMIRDELDLLSGSRVQRVDELIMTGNESFSDFIDISETTHRLNFKHLEAEPSGEAMSTHFIFSKGALEERVKFYITINSNISFTLKRDEFSTVDSFKNWVSLNRPVIHYQMAEEVSEMMEIKSDYYFKPITDRDLYLKGKVYPLVCSVTIPTDDLTFFIQPNNEENQRFIAPIFSVINETPMDISLELQSFKQETTIFRDVLPTKHEDWNTLNQEESKDIALGLLPIASENWIDLSEGVRYVAENKSSFLGKVKAKSTVDFTFVASHGRAFNEMLKPIYKLVFVFDF